MAVIVTENFAGDTVGNEPIGWTTFYQSPGQHWAVRTDMPSNATNSLKSESALWNHIDYDNASTILADISVLASVYFNNNGSRVSIYGRVNGHSAGAKFPEDGYAVEVRADGTLRIIKNLPNDTLTVLASSSITVGLGLHTIKMEIQGETINLYVDGSTTPDLTFSDSTYTGTGKPGFYSFYNGNTIWIDDVVFSDFTIPPTPPINPPDQFKQLKRITTSTLVTTGVESPVVLNGLPSNHTLTAHERYGDIKGHVLSGVDLYVSGFIQPYDYISVNYNGWVAGKLSFPQGALSGTIVDIL